MVNFGVYNNQQQTMKQKKKQYIFKDKENK